MERPRITADELMGKPASWADDIPLGAVEEVVIGASGQPSHVLIRMGADPSLALWPLKGAVIEDDALILPAESRPQRISRPVSPERVFSSGLFKTHDLSQWLKEDRWAAEEPGMETESDPVRLKRLEQELDELAGQAAKTDGIIEVQLAEAEKAKERTREILRRL